MVSNRVDKGKGLRPTSTASSKISNMKSTTNLTLCIILILLATILAITSAKPTEIKRHKRQSDQRIAELETLLALQKYGQHRLRDWGRGRELPGYGLVDFDKIGRRKKSTRFSPGDSNSNSGRIWSGSWMLGGRGGGRDEENDDQELIEPPTSNSNLNLLDQN